jgi:hypothetical protein
MSARWVLSIAQNPNGSVHVNRSPPKHSHPSGFLYNHEDGRTTFLRKRRQAPIRLGGVPTRKTIGLLKRVFTVYSSACLQFEETCCPLLHRSTFLASREFNDWRDIPWLSPNMSFWSTREHTAAQRNRWNRFWETIELGYECRWRNSWKSIFVQKQNTNAF